MRASGLSKAIAHNSTGEMSTWPSWSYRILLHRFGRNHQDQWLLVIAFAVVERVLELQTDTLVANRAFEQIPGYWAVLQSWDLVIAVWARRDIPEVTGWTDSHQLRHDISAVHALVTLLVLNDGRLGPFGVPVLLQHRRTSWRRSVANSKNAFFRSSRCVPCRGLSGSISTEE